MKNYIIFLIAIMALLSTACSEKQITEFTQSDLVKMQEDTNWVEITDTLHPNLGCSNHPGAMEPPPNELKWDQMKIIENQDEFEQLSNIMDTFSCWQSQNPNIDFDSYSLLLYSHKTGQHHSKTQFFKNDAEKEYKLLVHIHIESRELILYTLRNWLLVPKLKEDYKISVDTLRYMPK